MWLIRNPIIKIIDNLRMTKRIIDHHIQIKPIPRTPHLFLYITRNQIGRLVQPILPAFIKLNLAGDVDLEQAGARDQMAVEIVELVVS